MSSGKRRRTWLWVGVACATAGGLGGLVVAVDRVRVAAARSH